MAHVGELESIADVVRMASGSRPIEAICETCGGLFEYLPIPVRVPGMLDRVFQQHVCGPCLDAEVAESERGEKERRFELAMGRYRDNDRGSRLAKATFDSFVEGPHNAQALAKARAWVQREEPGNLLLVGPVRSGKSFLAACVYNALVAELRPVYWLNAGSLMSRIRGGFTNPERASEANSRIETAGRASILVLDDLGKVHPGKDVSWVEETFYAIVEERYRDELPTIVTTEWKSATLAERVGESVVTRLEHGAVVAGLRKPATAYRRVAG
jgi:DNA replication protein DnaC